MLKYWIKLRIIQIVIDFILVYASFLAAYFMRVGFVFSSDFPFWMYAFLAFCVTGAWLGFLVFAKYYRVPPRWGTAQIYDYILLFVGGGIANGLLIISYFFPRDVLFSRLISLYAFFFAVVLLCVTQVIFRWYLAQQKKNKKQKNIYKTLIIGANRVAEHFIEALKKDPYAPYEVIGVIDPYGIAKSVEGAPLLGKLNKLEEVCRTQKVKALIQCDGFEHTLNMISFCEEHDIKYQFDPALRGIYEKNLRVREVAGQTMISFVKRDFESENKRRIYRVGDFLLRQVFDVD